VAICSSKSTFVGSKCHLGVWWAALRFLSGEELMQQTSQKSFFEISQILKDPFDVDWNWAN
jgi:hypothetical protein